MAATVTARHCSMASTIEQCRSEEHTSELQSQSNLVCRLLLEKKKKNKKPKSTRLIKSHSQTSYTVISMRTKNSTSNCLCPLNLTLPTCLYDVKRNTKRYH